MAKKVRTQTQVKKKKKIWLPINAPKTFGEMKIGETNVFTKDDAINKTVSINMMNLTGDMRKQNITAKLVIYKILNNAGQTQLIEYKMAPSFLKRFVRRRRDKLEISEVYTTKDDKKIRIKPLLITTNSTRGSTQTSLRNKLHELVGIKIKEMSYEGFIKDVVSYKFQNYLKSELKKIHPLRNCEIRAFKLVDKEDVNKITETVQVEDVAEEIEIADEKKTSPKKAKKTEVKEEDKAEAKEEDKAEAKEEDKAEAKEEDKKEK